MNQRFLGKLLLAAYCTAMAAAPPSVEEIDAAVAALSEKTGFVKKHPIRVEAIGRDGWKAWLDGQIRENVKPEEIRAEELTLKRFGLIPRDYDLRAATIELLGEQAAAVYDHRKKRMLFVEGAPEGMRDLVLVHELAHALADQSYDLTRFLEKGPKTDEAQLARMAVVEGQATWLMYETQLNRMGMSLSGNSQALGMIAGAGSSLAAGMFPVFEKAPLYLRETLLFPYTAGLLFQQAALDRLGKKAFSEVLTRPPATAREILHPEIWLSGWKAEAAALPKLDRQGEYRALNAGSVGELDWRILFEQYAGREEALAIAPGWRGGTFELLEHKKDGRLVLRFAATWADEETSKRFMRLYQKVMAGKWSRHEARRASEEALTGEGDGGRYVITRKGRAVYGMEGMKP
ncbi:MAG: hypothetical protein C0504_02680 [Candidatus Solibacter sp.]|nr:hypothetical protein [Candidatus Solibacter sp.]